MPIQSTTDCGSETTDLYRFTQALHETTFQTPAPLEAEKFACVERFGDVANRDELDLSSAGNIVTIHWLQPE